MVAAYRMPAKRMCSTIAATVIVRFFTFENFKIVKKNRGVIKSKIVFVMA